MRRPAAILALTAVAAVAPVAAAPAQAAPAKDIVQTATAAGKFKTLTRLVKKAGLAGTLSGPGPFTVFAPTDAAFRKVPKKTLRALSRNKTKLRAVLLHHVADGRIGSADVVKLRSARMLDGTKVRIRVRGGNVFVDKAKVVTPDVEASNGVIHVVNRVLIPR